MRRRIAWFAGQGWRVASACLPFADAATDELPMPRLLRLALFQVAVGMAMVLLGGVLNRVMIVELGVPASLVAVFIALPLLIAPLRALIGYRSDTHRSALGWRRVPYIWFGSLLQFGGLAIMPFALILLSGDNQGPPWLGTAAAAFAFVLTGIGVLTTQTAGLALATDLAPESARPRVVALLYVMLLVGMVGSALVFGLLLSPFSELRLIQVVQGAAVATMVLNLTALWKQEARAPSTSAAPRPPFLEALHTLASVPGFPRFLAAVGLGTAALSMQDILLEPFGAQFLGLTVAETTRLTALLACGAIAAFGFAARRLGRGADPQRLAALGLLVGVLAFAAISFAVPLGSVLMFCVGTALIGFGAGLFAVATLVAAMEIDHGGCAGLVLGAWSAAQACAAGLGMASGAALRDLVSAAAARGALGPALSEPSVGYVVVYQLEIGLLFATLAVLGPLVRSAARRTRADAPRRFGLAGLPG